MSTGTRPPREARLDVRLSRRHRELIEQAALASGQSLSDFAVASLVQVANQTLEQAAVTRLSLRDQQAFMNMLKADAKPNAALRRAAQRYRKR